jgi:hypothetical protein
MDDAVRVLFFATREEADAHVRAVFRANRRSGVPLHVTWPPPRMDADFDLQAPRDMAAELAAGIAAVRTAMLSHPDVGETGLAAFVWTMEGEETAHAVYEREGRPSQFWRLSSMSAGLHFLSVSWGAEPDPDGAD